MRILILNWRDIKHPLAGGAEISTHEHAKRWVNAGHNVIQFSSFVNNELPEQTIDGVRFIRRGTHHTVHVHAFFYYMKHLRGSIDLIVDEFHFIPFFTPFYTKAKKIAFIHETAEEIWFKNRQFPLNFMGYYLEPYFFSFYKDVPFMTVSRSTKNDLIRFGIKEKKIHVIHNGAITLSSKNKKEREPVIMFLGRLAKDKGIEDAIKAFYLIQKQMKNVFFWVVGREEEKGYMIELKKIVTSHGMKKKVIFFDYVSEKEKFDLLKKAWVLIHPSIKEGWGLTVVEAASQGTPAVAYDTSGLRDSINDGVTGLLVKEKNPESLTAKILVLLNEGLLYNRLSDNAVSWSKKFDWKTSARQSLALIESIV